MHSSPLFYVFRLRAHEDLKRSILRFARDQQINAGIILTCAGSVEQYNLRFANQTEASAKKGFFEIVSLTGTFSRKGCHLHVSLSDSSGLTIGGHLLDETLIYTTAEIVVASLPGLLFEREPDPTYGFLELKVKKETDPL